MVKLVVLVVVHLAAVCDDSFFHTKDVKFRKERNIVMVFPHGPDKVGFL